MKAEEVTEEVTKELMEEVAQELQENPEEKQEEEFTKETLQQFMEIQKAQLKEMEEQYLIIEKLIHNQIEVKDGNITKLFKELESYKAQSGNKYLDQVMKSVIKVHRDMERKIESDDWGTLTLERMEKEYQYVWEDLTDFLEENEVYSFQAAPGELFDLSKHKITVELTEDKNLDGRVKMSTKKGYMKADRVLILENVTVYKYKN